MQLKHRLLTADNSQPRRRAYTVERWYDRSTRSHVVQTKDERGNQIGEAFYTGTRSDADREVAARAAAINQEKS